MRLAKNKIERYKCNIEGIVQGVGFRPFIYKIALKNNLAGFVNNSSEGVHIEIEGSRDNCENFFKDFHSCLPPLAKIDKITKNKIDIKNSKKFIIIQSETSDINFASVSPDIAICNDCLRELKDKNNRRFNYYLINCTNCGPRYTIIDKVPYDRINTSMNKFKMCIECEKEYTNPLDRRYHAQPISCHECGPSVKFYKTHNEDFLAKDDEAIKLCAKSIKNGNIVAVKGLGGFHLMCDATNIKTIKKLRIRKNRPTKPFAVMFEKIEDIKNFATLSKKEEELILSKEKPIVIVNKKKSNKNRKKELFVAPFIDRIGVFLPYTPLHYLLFEYLDCPIIATSANLSDEPIIRSKKDLCHKLSYVVDYVLDFNRDIVNACDDSVVQAIGDKKETLRLSRGYAPKYIKLPFKLKNKILCVGANQKNIITLCFEDILVISPHIGDLNSIEAMEYFERTIETFKRFYNFEPDCIVCDKHPRYETLKWAEKSKIKNDKIKIFKVQHHYAHILSCMAEFNIKKKVLGFSFDGTGYGDDGNIWGGEVFECDENSYKRAYQFKYIKFLSGEKAIKEPKRIALSRLFEKYSLHEILLFDIPLVESFSVLEIKNLYKIWQQTTLKTSSIGRLFDAIASLSDILQVSNYEGESGLIIESYYDEKITDSFSFKIEDNIIDITNLEEKSIEIMEKNKNLNKKKTLISSMFINTLVNIIIEIASKYDLDIVLSGGVFQNKTLLLKCIEKLKKQNKNIYFQQNTPVNDGGISLGQAWWAIHNISDDL